MRGILIVFFMAVSLFGSPEKDKMEKLKSIEKYAISVGHGPRLVYVFVDPMCKYSREFVQNIFEMKKLQETTTYKIFLSKLNKFDSQGLINFIMESDNKVAALKAVMVDNELGHVYIGNVDKEPIEASEEIDSICNCLHIKKRPFLVLASR